MSTTGKKNSWWLRRDLRGDKELGLATTFSTDHSTGLHMKKVKAGKVNLQDKINDILRIKLKVCILTLAFMFLIITYLFLFNIKTLIDKRFIIKIPFLIFFCYAPTKI